MRVLIVSPGYPFAPGGIETHVGELSTQLSALGHQVQVWTHERDSPAASTVTLGSVPVHGFRVTRSNRFPVSAGLHAAVRRRLPKVDIVHVHGYHATAAAAALLVPRDVPVVFTPHYHGVGHSGLARLLHRPYRPLGHAIFRRSDAVVAVSDAEAALIRADLAITPHTIRNGANVARLHAAAPWPDAGPVVLVAGRLERYKQVELTLDAFAGSEVPGRLVVLGGGPDLERIQRLAAASRRAGDIRVLGRVGEAEVGRWFRSANVVVSMSQHEAFGLVAIEGVAAGATALLSDIPAHREVQAMLPPGRVRITNPEDLAAGLELLASVPNAGPAPVRSWHDVAVDHAGLYRSLVAGSD